MISEKRKLKNRENLGAELKQHRNKAGYTQKALAEAIDLEYYTMISQMELGYISIPAPLWEPIALTLGINRAEWVSKCMHEYSPEVFKAMFGNKSRSEVVRLLNAFEKGALDEILKSLEKKKKQD